MSCHDINRATPRKRIAIISGAMAGAAGIVAYVSLANPAFAATLSAALAFTASLRCALQWQESEFKSNDK